MTIDHPPANNSYEEHDCPYSERVAKYKRSVGYGSLQATYLDDLVASYHHDECPPTHIGTGPTKQWEEILEYTRV
jgi:hypothetical protein